MFIKFKFVMAALVIVVALGVAGGIMVLLNQDPPPTATSTLETPESTGGTESKPRALVGDAPAKTPPTNKTPVDSAEVSKTLRAIKAANAKATPNSKQKDAFEGEGWKINLYEETGDDHYDRAKIDKDRDDTWDEKWNWKGGRWEKDGGALVWSGDAWVDPKAADKAPKAVDKAAKADDKPAAGGDRDTALAQYATRVLTERASGKKAKDITRGSGPKINLYDDDGDGKWDRGKVDTNRDDTWDQKWTVKGGVLERKIEASGEVSVFEDGAWVSKKLRALAAHPARAWP